MDDNFQKTVERLKLAKKSQSESDIDLNIIPYLFENIRTIKHIGTNKQLQLDQNPVKQKARSKPPHLLQEEV